MDMTMILGLMLAGSIAMLSGNKNQDKDNSKTKPSNPEFVVWLGDKEIALAPKKKTS